MTDGNAAGRKTDAPVTNNMIDVLDRLSDGIRIALTRSGAEEASHHDGRGRVRDHEIAIAAKLGTVSAQLVGALVKLGDLNDRRLKNSEK